MLLLLAAIAVGIGVTAMLLTAREPLPDFRVFEAGPERKQAFFEYMTPVIEASNERILALFEFMKGLDPENLSG